MWNFSSARMVRWVLAPVLSLWVAGAGCMLGCEGFIAAAEPGSGVAEKQRSGHRSALVASEDACSSGQSPDCCAKNAGDTEARAQRTRNTVTALITADQSSSGLAKGCPLAVSRAAVVSKPRGDEESGSLALPHAPLPVERSLEQESLLSIAPRLPNRGHTYLRCCAFLI